MRIIYGLIIAALGVALLVGVQKWRGPVLPAITVELKPLELRIVASGEVRYQTLARIGSEITGTVLVRHVREGDRVNKGDLLIELNRDQAQSGLAQAKTLLQQLQKISRPQAQAALKEAQENANQASREARRRQALASKGTISTEQAEQARRLELTANTLLTRAQLTANSLAANSIEEQLLRQRITSAEADLAKTRIYAPFAGRVQTRNVEPGDLVQPSTVLLEIARSNTENTRDGLEDGLEVVVALDEKNFAPLQLNQPVQLIADAWPEQTVAGMVSFIAPAVDSGRGTIDVHIKVLADASTQTLATQQKPHAFLQGMTVSANIIANQRDATLVLPNDYLLTNTSGKTQVLRWKNGKVNAVPVQLGLRNMTHSEIIAGLNEGDVVVHADKLQADKLSDGKSARVRFEQAPHVIR
ncbi:efflux RND transporter periplasmic adaptor subunit [Oceanisphaera sp. IT1-181]|uniref:efflux RND transporter periplasmic adaptor subunit n=1 Tax=Oceanisphaera sp. IT1-181 TaxID=3081199 RepID=UPI0029CA0D1E|nr:efflux RND transporter periplasmic adaptor subunit [Oceanisphaera sp. IT1-181]